MLAREPATVCGSTAAASPMPINLGPMVQPLPARGIFRLDDYFSWCPNLIKDGGKYYLVYSRWPRSKNTGGWLTDSEVAIAVGESPEGPFTHLKVLLKGRGPGHWDEQMAHNPKLYRFGNRYFLYYISSRAGPSRGHMYHTKRIGVAVADSILGPYQPQDKPLLEPTPPAYVLTTNPAVTAMSDGRFLMMFKTDRRQKLPTDPLGQRVQAIAVANRPDGPFQIQTELAIRDINCEDADLWYDRSRRKYFAVFHAYTYVGLIESDDGFQWQPVSPAARYIVISCNELRCADGTILKTERPLQRPDIFVENGEPRALALGIPKERDWYCVVVPLKP